MAKHVGLKVVKNGKNVSGPIKPFLARVQAAAIKQAKNKNHPGGPVENMKPFDPAWLWAQPIPDHKRCDFTFSDTARNRAKDRVGNRCGRWAMDGATRCPSHGGYRQNPEHKATVRRLADVEALARDSAALAVIRNANPHDAQHVKSTMQQRGLPLSPQTIAQGIDALTHDDNGKAWRRFIKQATAPKPQQRARKQKK
jgi:hypothetical protein